MELAGTYDILSYRSEAALHRFRQHIECRKGRKKGCIVVSMRLGG